MCLFFYSLAMAEQENESAFLRSLRQIEDDDTYGTYAQAKIELARAKTKAPGRQWFDVCHNASTEARQYVVERFKRDGLLATMRDYEEWSCGDTYSVSCVRVELPPRK